MSLRTWLGILLILGVVIVAWKLLGAAGFSAPLRSRHADPALAVPAGAVVVSEEGKTFHKPGCTYIHGKREVMPAETAVREGYAPCVRCERETVDR
jgi:hypothetical protein